MVSAYFNIGINISYIKGNLFVTVQADFYSIYVLIYCSLKMLQ